MSANYYTGSYREDGLFGENRGWIVGSFMADLPRKNNEVEIKYWEINVGGSSKHPTKTSTIVECTFILKGKAKAVIDGEHLVLNAGDYVVIKPGIVNNAVLEILEDTAGLTIKAPSDPTAKKIIE